MTAGNLIIMMIGCVTVVKTFQTLQAIFTLTCFETLSCAWSLVHVNDWKE
jgi:hypothetical protein